MEIKKFLLIFFSCCFAIPNSFAYDFIVNGLAYNIKKDGIVAVTMKNKYNVDRGMDGGYSGNIVIPTSVEYKNHLYKVTEIGERAFAWCDGVKSVKIPEGIKKIDNQGVGCLKNITSIHIPASVVELVPGCFMRNSKLKKVTVSAANKNYCVVNNCIYNKKKTQLLLVPPTIHKYIFPSSVTTVLDWAFTHVKLKILKIPKTLKYVGGNSFTLMKATPTIINETTLQLYPGTKNKRLPFWGYQPCTVHSN